MRRVTLSMLVLASCSSNPSAEECAMLASQGRAFTNSVLDKNGGSCASDSDCTTARAMLACYTGCPRAVAKNREPSAQGELQGIDDSLCSGSKCMVTEGCEAVHAKCMLGTCKTVTGEPDGGARDGG